MLWLYILLGIAALFALFCCTRMGLRVAFGDVFSADVTFWFLRFQVAPSKKKAKKKPKKEPKKRESADIQKTLKKIPKPTRADLRAAYELLCPPAKRALHRFGRGIRIRPLTLSFIIAGRDDPAKAAETYGDACAVLWSVMPALEALIDIPKPSIHIGTDFDAEKLRAQGEVGVSIRIGTLLAVGLEMAIPGLCWLLKFQKAHKQDKPRPDAQEKSPAAA